MNRRKNLVTVKGGKSRKPKLGSGARFRALEHTLEKKGGKGKKKVRNVAALAASIGRKKLGSRRYSYLAAAGRKKG